MITPYDNVFVQIVNSSLIFSSTTSIALPYSYPIDYGGVSSGTTLTMIGSGAGTISGGVSLTTKMSDPYYEVGGEGLPPSEQTTIEWVKTCDADSDGGPYIICGYSFFYQDTGQIVNTGVCWYDMASDITLHFPFSSAIPYVMTNELTGHSGISKIDFPISVAVSRGRIVYRTNSSYLIAPDGGSGLTTPLGKRFIALNLPHERLNYDHIYVEGLTVGLAPGVVPGQHYRDYDFYNIDYRSGGKKLSDFCINDADYEIHVDHIVSGGVQQHDLWVHGPNGKTRLGRGLGGSVVGASTCWVESSQRKGNHFAGLMRIKSDDFAPPTFTHAYSTYHAGTKDPCLCGYSKFGYKGGCPGEGIGIIDLPLEIKPNYLHIDGNDDLIVTGEFGMAKLTANHGEAWVVVNTLPNRGDGLLPGDLANIDEDFYTFLPYSSCTSTSCENGDQIYHVRGVMRSTLSDGLRFRRPDVWNDGLSDPPTSPAYAGYATPSWVVGDKGNTWIPCQHQSPPVTGFPSDERRVAPLGGDFRLHSISDFDDFGENVGQTNIRRLGQPETEWTGLWNLGQVAMPNAISRDKGLDS